MESGHITVGTWPVSWMCIPHCKPKGQQLAYKLPATHKVATSFIERIHLSLRVTGPQERGFKPSVTSCPVMSSGNILDISAVFISASTKTTVLAKDQLKLTIHALLPCTALIRQIFFFKSCGAQIKAPHFWSDFQNWQNFGFGQLAGGEDEQLVLWVIKAAEGLNILLGSDCRQGPLQQPQGKSHFLFFQGHRNCLATKAKATNDSPRL